jgi:hypothetical protein
MEGIPYISGCAKIVNDDANIEWIAILIAIIDIVIDENVEESYSKGSLCQ